MSLIAEQSLKAFLSLARVMMMTSQSPYYHVLKELYKLRRETKLTRSGLGNRVVLTKRGKILLSYLKHLRTTAGYFGETEISIIKRAAAFLNRFERGAGVALVHAGLVAAEDKDVYIGRA